MNNARVSIAPQRLKFPGNIVGTTTPATPTLAEVMTKLSQIQQNQARIFDAVVQLQINQISICVMLGEMFEITTSKPNIGAALNQLSKSTVSGIARNIR
jgi:hypothetical protein